MRIVFAGTPEVAVPTLNTLAASPHEIAGVITRPPARRRRSSALIPSPVAQAATEHAIPVIETSRPSESESLASLQELRPDLGVVVAYGALLRPDVLTVPRLGWINLHFSSLPRWRGAAPVQYAIWNQDPTVGLSVFQLEAGLDTGPVFTHQELSLTGRETSGDLLAKLAEIGAQQVLDTVSLIASGSVPTPQSSEGITVAPQLTRDDAKVEFHTSAAAVDAHIRAMTPAPGAWTTCGASVLKLGPVNIGTDPELDDLAVGQLAVTKNVVAVGCASGYVELGQVGPAGKKWMDATAWARGLRETHLQLGESHE